MCSWVCQAEQGKRATSGDRQAPEPCDRLWRMTSGSVTLFLCFMTPNPNGNGSDFTHCATRHCVSCCFLFPVFHVFCSSFHPLRSSHLEELKVFADYVAHYEGLSRPLKLTREQATTVTVSDSGWTFCLGIQFSTCVCTCFNYIIAFTLSQWTTGRSGHRTFSSVIDRLINAHTHFSCFPFA